MEQRHDDLGDDGGLPRPGTEEPDAQKGSAEGDAAGGPGNVSVDEPTAGALDGAGAPGGEDADTQGDDEDAEASDDTSEDTSDA